MLGYEERLHCMLARHVGVWDVLAACNRDGSLDSAITDSRANPFARLRRLAPGLRDVAFNGQTAGRFAPVFRDAGYSVTVLPSSSPAHAGRSYEQKLALWRAWWAGWRSDRPGQPGSDSARCG